ncbi:hypothetical protein [Mesorhizobium opportunistum]
MRLLLFAFVVLLFMAIGFWLAAELVIAGAAHACVISGALGS